MQCDHCLRGCAENKDIKNDYISQLLLQVDYIGNVTFTGGEPSLNVVAIEHFIAECKRLNVSIGGFYIATNGLNVKENFVIACLKLYAMSDEKEACRVDVSNDLFHAGEGSYDTELLDGPAFFGRKFSEEHYDYQDGRSLISEGNANENGMGSRANTAPDIETQEDLQNTEVYLNVNGDIINGCDWSFETQDSGEYTLCKVGGLSEYVDGLEEY